MNDYIIRVAEQEDLEQIKQLYHDTVTSINSNDYNEEQIRVWSDVSGGSHNFSEKIIEQNFFVADLESKIIGFGSVTDEGYLDYMYVHKDYQRKGVAKKLLHEIEKTADELKVEKIYSHVSITARGFFEKHGYTRESDQNEKYRGVEFINSVMVKSKVKI